MTFARLFESISRLMGPKRSFSLDLRAWNDNGTPRKVLGWGVYLFEGTSLTANFDASTPEHLLQLVREHFAPPVVPAIDLADVGDAVTVTASRDDPPPAIPIEEATTIPTTQPVTTKGNAA